MIKILIQTPKGKDTFTSTIINMISKAYIKEYELDITTEENSDNKIQELLSNENKYSRVILLDITNIESEIFSNINKINESTNNKFLYISTKNTKGLNMYSWVLIIDPYEYHTTDVSHLNIDYKKFINQKDTSNTNSLFEVNKAYNNNITYNDKIFNIIKLENNLIWEYYNLLESLANSNKEGFIYPSDKIDENIRCLINYTSFGYGMADYDKEGNIIYNTHHKVRFSLEDLYDYLGTDKFYDFIYYGLINNNLQYKIRKELNTLRSAKEKYIYEFIKSPNIQFRIYKNDPIAVIISENKYEDDIIREINYRYYNLIKYCILINKENDTICSISNHFIKKKIDKDIEKFLKELDINDKEELA